ncbi:hypothetical protein, partial [Ruegeria sp. HKCCA5426]|uniref:hypothetical protein n=1 Tax=Ruegeria sp. HKCCA5426 TaxID=2682985 RepID=UPI001C2C591B
TDYVDLTQKISFTDDGPAITVEDASGNYSSGAQDAWADDPGEDGFASLDIELVSYKIGTGSVVAVGSDLTKNGDYSFAGSITDDFNGDGTDETVDFTLVFDPATDMYDLQVSTPPGSVVELSTADGSLDAGGPDPVRTLTIDSSEIVFAAVNPTSYLAPADIKDLLNLPEADWESTATFLSAEQMNVSTSGIGNGNNNLNGNANHGIDGDTTSGGKVDESFVVDPTGFDVSAVKVFIDNSVGGYDNPPEDLWYMIYFADGTTSGPIEVLDGDLSPEAGGQESFVVGDPMGPNNIDAIQLFMGQGTIKIPVIEFTTSQEFSPEPLQMTLNATETDGDTDTDTDGFTIDLDTVA